MTKRVRSPFTEVFRNAVQQRDRGQGRPGDRAADERGLIAGRRSVVAGAISDKDYYRTVSHDISGMLNTVNFAAGTDLSRCPEVRRSILNFGFPDMMHRSIDDLSVNDVGGEIEWALATFEPRLVKGSIKVRRDESIDTASLRIRFIVSAELHHDPLNLPIHFFADLERDTGRIVIQQRR